MTVAVDRSATKGATAVDRSATKGATAVDRSATKGVIVVDLSSATKGVIVVGAMRHAAITASAPLKKTNTVGSINQMATGRKGIRNLNAGL